MLFFRGLPAFRDKVVASFPAEQGDGRAARGAGRDAIVAGGFAVCEGGCGIELPEDFFGAVVGGATDFSDKLLGSLIADGVRVAIHSSLAAEFSPEVLDREDSFQIFQEKWEAGGVE